MILLPERVRAARWLFAAVLVLAAGISTVRADVNADELVGFDRRRERRAAPANSQKAAHDELRRRSAGVEVDFDPVLRSPKWVRVRDGELTGSRGEGRTVTARTAAKHRADPDGVVKAFIEEHQELFGHGPGVLDGARKTRDAVTPHNGVRTTVWQQRLDDIPVYEGVFSAHITKRGELVSVSSQFVPDAPRAAKTRAVRITARRAVEVAVPLIGEQAGEITTSDEPSGAERIQRFKASPLPGEAEARLVWFALDRDTLRLCWQVELTRRQFQERFRVLVDAQTGEVMLHRKLTVEIGAVKYRVYTNDSPTPMRPGWPVPNATQPPFVSNTVVTIAALDTNASPLGWINDGEMTLRGNNVDGRLDRDGDDRPDAPRVTATIGGDGLRAFDFPVDSAQHPTNHSAAAAVSLFYWCNFMHDRLYQLGFTEARGNFQKDNFGRGGFGNDAVLADAQDGSGVNNANFTPGVDGLPGRIQMFLFTSPNPPHDGDFDAEVILHEYTHGLSDRLVGSGAGISQFQTYGLAEGWSDFFAEAILTGPEHSLDANYPMGGYASYLLNGLQESYYFGIRRYPYTTATNVSPLQFRDIDPSQASLYPGIPRNPISGTGASEVHRQGEVWCLMLWEVRAALLRRWNPSPANYAASNDLVLRIILDGMDYTPPNPTFVQARDGIFTAERLITGGANAFRLWQAFAKRGLGMGASAPDVTTTYGIVGSYQTPPPPVFDVSPRLVNFGMPVGGTLTPATAQLSVLNPTDELIEWTATADSPDVVFTPTNGTTPIQGATVVAVFTNGFTNLALGSNGYTIIFSNTATHVVVSATVAVMVTNAPPPPTESLAVTPTSNYSIDGPEGGPFTPQTRIYTLQALTLPLLWRATNIPPWLTFSQTNGAIDSGEFENISVSVNALASTLADGTYISTPGIINIGTGHRVDLPVALLVGRNDHFVEDFTFKTFDLQNVSLMFTPSGDSYTACATPVANFPSDTGGATTVAALRDDEYRMVVLDGGAEYSLFGVRTNVLWIGANGNVTPDPGGNTNFFHPGLVEFFNAPRVSALYADLNPEQGGRVSWQQFADRVAVTWENVPQFGVPNTNDCQIELFFDGHIRITWLRAEYPGPICGLSRGVGIPPTFASSDLGSEANCAPTATLLAPLITTEGAGVITGTVLLSISAPTNMEVTLVSGNTNEILVPATVLIPANQTSVQFPITVLDDALLDGTQTASITAEFPDRAPASATISVFDNESARIILAIPGETTEGDGVVTNGGLVILSAAAGRDIPVSLTSSNAARLAVPDTVIVRAGDSMAWFDLVAVDDNVLNGDEDVSVRASVQGWGYDRDVITVRDNEPRVLAVSLPAAVEENGGNVFPGGFVHLAAPPTAPVIVSLTSSIPATLLMQGTVEIPAGAMSNSFALILVDNLNTNSFDFVNVIASAPGFNSATGSVRVIDDERPTTPKNPSPANGATRVRPITVLSWNLTPAPQPGVITFDIYLGTNAAPTNLVGSTTTTNFAVPGQLLGGVTYFWKVIARRDPFFKEGPVWSFATAGLDHFSFGPVPNPASVGGPFEMVIGARDEYDLLVLNHITPVTLTNTAAFRSSSTIVISEVDPGDFDRVEFQNVSDRNINVAGWQVALYDWTSWPAPKTVFTIPGPALCRTGENFQVRTLLSRFFPGTYPSFNLATNLAWNYNTNGNPIAVVLRDNFGTVVDFMCAVDAVPAQIVSPVPVPAAHWNGAPVAGFGDVFSSYLRYGTLDHDNATDWLPGPRTVGTNNTALLVPFTNWTSVPMIAAPVTNWAGGVGTVSVTILDEARSVSLGVTDGGGHAGQSMSFDVLAVEDISVTATAPDTVIVGDVFAATFTITNRGLEGTASVWFSNRLSVDAVVLNAVPSQGACVVTNNSVVCELGGMIGGDVATVVLTEKALLPTAVTNAATIVRAEPDPYLPNNSVSTLTRAGYPQIIISDATNSEPVGATNTLITFTLRLSAPSTATSRVFFASSDGSATAGLDYLATNGVVVFPPGSTSQVASVVVLPDSLSESNEVVLLNLTGAENAEITDNLAVGTINDNDGNVFLSVFDTALAEGDAGGNIAIFEIRLSAPSGKVISAFYQTADLTAFAGFDYLATYGLASFPPGVTNRFVSVPVVTDAISEPSKAFTFNLSSPANVVLSRAQAFCFIADDDQSQLDHLAVSTTATQALVNLPFPVTVSARDANNAPVTNFSGSLHLHAVESLRMTNAGTNAIPWEFPLGAGFHDSRLQVIYTAAELGGAGLVTALALNVTNAPGQVLSNFTIRTRAVPYTQFPSAQWLQGGWITNHQRDESILATGWVTFAFRAPFPHDGTNHLLVDFSFNNSFYSSDGLCRATAITGLRALAQRSDGAFGNPLDWAGTYPPVALQTRVPNVRFTLGRGVEVLPAVVTNPPGGNWSGDITFAAGATNLVLHAVDDAGHVGLLTNLVVVLDSDGDGLPDWWELAHGFDPAIPADAVGDVDGDGLTNLQEFQAGTDPRDSGSTVRIVSSARSTNSFSVLVQSVTGKGYVLDAAPALDNVWSAVTDRYPGTGGVIELLHRPLAPGETWFYRVRVVP